MGLPDPAFSVVPKVSLLAAPREGGSIASRFYVPWNCHVAHSTTGGLCIAAATHIAGTVAAEFAAPQPDDPHTVMIEHPSGRLTIHIHAENSARNLPHIARASVVLTARPLFDGFAFPNASCS
jgi:2-methylaconitate cis-trans-isomerase PrpF